MPLLRTKKEFFQWLKDGKKTIDIRKGAPQRGDVAYFLSGPHKLKLSICKRESGRLAELVRVDNFRLVIPGAGSVDEVIGYLRMLYGGYDGVFTAYHVCALNPS